MAKDRFMISTTTELVGFLDLDQDEKMVVQVEHGKGDNAIVVSVDLMSVLSECIGQNISLKLAEEEDKVK